MATSLEKRLAALEAKPRQCVCPPELEDAYFGALAEFLEAKAAGDRLADADGGKAAAQERLGQAGEALDAVMAKLPPADQWDAARAEDMAGRLERAN